MYQLAVVVLTSWCSIFAVSSAWAQSAEVLNTSGNALLREERYAEAIEQYTKALAINPQFARSLFNRAQCNYHRKKYDVATDDFQACLAVNDKDHEAYYWLGKCFMARKMALSAANSFQDATRLKEDPRYYAALAEARFHCDDFDKSQQAVDKALALEKGHLEALRVNKLLIDRKKSERVKKQARFALKAEREGREAREQMKQEQVEAKTERRAMQEAVRSNCSVILAEINRVVVVKGISSKTRFQNVISRFGDRMTNSGQIRNVQKWCLKCQTGTDTAWILIEEWPSGNITASGPLVSCP